MCTFKRRSGARHAPDSALDREFDAGQREWWNGREKFYVRRFSHDRISWRYFPKEKKTLDRVESNISSETWCVCVKMRGTSRYTHTPLE